MQGSKLWGCPGDAENLQAGNDLRDLCSQATHIFEHTLRGSLTQAVSGSGLGPTP